MDYLKLSKEVSYVLRHAPWEYELELDSEGWVDINQLLMALSMNPLWKSLRESDLNTMMEMSEKKRHEIIGGKIRALYGHSVTGKVIKRTAVPPVVLYHGTARDLVEKILVQGLKPMGRQFVHLSVDKETAMAVGKRKDSKPVLLRVDSEKAFSDGIKFHPGNNVVWLSDCIPANYIFVESNN